MKKKKFIIKIFLTIFFTFLLTTSSFIFLFAQVTIFGQKIDEEYTRLIKEATTMPEFLSPLVSYLPRSEGIPTPKDILGYIAGAPGKLTYYEDILKYMRALAEASPNVEIFTIGKTSEGREMVVVVVANAEVISNLQKYKDLLKKLADPRQVKTEIEAEAIIREAKPVYWLTGNLHSPESGAAEMSLELAYRLAVDENPIIKTIRDNLIVLITPSAEPDGHDKHTDWFYKYNKDVIDFNKISRIPYWGKYTFHDNNRDYICLSQPEATNFIKAYFEWRPTVMQDNHESIPFLYVSSGTGPYNETYHPSLTSEWNLIAWWEVTRLSSYGMPGVWTHGFWDGWAPNYLFSIANNHNAVGRFYETFGNAIGNTMEREVEDRFLGGAEEEKIKGKAWFMPIRPYSKVVWSMRNNINYQQTATLQAFYLVATNKEFFLFNYWKRGFDSYNSGRTVPPYAYIIPSGQKDPFDTAYLINVLLKQGIEVHQAKSSLKVGQTSFPSGSYIIRLDQPYRNLVINLLGVQKFPPNAPTPYDDVGWTLGYHMDIKTVAVDDKSIFDVPIDPVTQPIKPSGKVIGGRASAAYIINHGTINNLITARIKLKAFKVLAAEAPFTMGERTFDAGSMIIPVAGAGKKIHEAVQSIANEIGLEIISSPRLPQVKTHELDVPRIAIFHTWHSTQDDGWVRFAFDQLEIPYSYIHKDHLRAGNLKKQYDVIILSNAAGTLTDLVNEIDPNKWGPLAFVKSPEFKHLGTPDSCLDITGGMGIEGVNNLFKFVEQGGLLIALHNMVRIPVECGMIRGISIYNPTPEFFNPGSLLRGIVVNNQHPIAYGYEKEIALYRRHAGPLLNLDKELEKFVVVKYASEGDICLSGLVKGQKEIQGKAAIAAVPLGKGNIVLFTFNPFWRAMSTGQYMFVFNSILNYNDFSAGYQQGN
jgi:hypothetical protein